MYGREEINLVDIWGRGKYGKRRLVLRKLI